MQVEAEKQEAGLSHPSFLRSCDTEAAGSSLGKSMTLGVHQTWVEILAVVFNSLVLDSLPGRWGWGPCTAKFHMDTVLEILVLPLGVSLIQTGINLGKVLW